MDRDKLWAIMSSKGISTHLITIIQKMYKENIIRVNASDGISDDFRVINQGTRQGCLLSPVLFNLYLDVVIRTWLTKLKTSKYYKEFILTHYYLQMTSLLFLTQKTICNRQFIYYIEYPKSIIWKLPQNRRRYLVLLSQTT